MTAIYAALLSVPVKLPSVFGETNLEKYFSLPLLLVVKEFVMD